MTSFGTISPAAIANMTVMEVAASVNVALMSASVVRERSANTRPTAIRMR
jgi:hypothetical protein